MTIVVASGNHTSSRQVSDDQGEIKGKQITIAPGSTSRGEETSHLDEVIDLSHADDDDSDNWFNGIFGNIR